MSQDVHTTARLYLCTDARKSRGDFEDFVDAAFAGGVDIVQLRDKSLEAAEELELLEVLHSVAQRHGRLWAVNDRADLASLAGAPVFHIGQKDIPFTAAREFLGKGTVIGMSTHTPEQVDAARAIERAEAGDSGRVSGVVPWFAIGGIDLSNVEQVVDAGARRIVVVRAITEADDPAGAARALLAALDAGADADAGAASN